MKRYIARHVLTAKVTALMLLTLCILQAQIRAQGMTSYIVIFPSVGLVPGQSLRLTLFNPNGTPVRAQARSHHSGGVNVCFGDGSVRFIQPGAFYSFVITRYDIPLPGDERTGRIQMLPSVSLTFSEAILPVVVSMETISISDGTSNTVFFSEVIPSAPNSGGGKDILIGGYGSDYLMGIVPGQTLRVTLFNPPASETDTARQPANAHVKVFDGRGNQIAQSAELAILPGESRSFDFDRAALHLAGEPGTNRAQVRIKPFFDFKSERLVRSFEIVDNNTGKTVVLAGQECLVFFLGGIPSN
jgi:prepilin-type processing-associated H-X9-DG protein